MIITGDKVRKATNLDPKKKQAIKFAKHKHGKFVLTFLGVVFLLLFPRLLLYKRSTEKVTLLFFWYNQL